jgi:hypothetical protein
MDKSPLQLTVAGTKDGILMIEGLSDFLSEEIMVSALTLGHKAIGDICDALQQFQSLAGTTKKTDTLRKTPADLVDKMDTLYGSDVIKALSISDKHERGRAVGGVESKISAYFATASTTSANAADSKLETDEGSLPVAVTEEEDAATAVEPELTEAAEEDEASELATSSTAKSTKKLSVVYDSVDIKVIIILYLSIFCDYSIFLPFLLVLT